MYKWLLSEKGQKIVDWLPEDFPGYRIVHISDLHNVQMSNENVKLFELLKAAGADMTAITGDIIDSNHTEVDIVIKFITEAVEIAPCFSRRSQFSVPLR